MRPFLHQTLNRTPPVFSRFNVLSGKINPKRSQYCSKELVVKIMPETTYYDMLSLRPNADVESIKRAYREKIRTFHPDSLAGELARRKGAGNYGGAYEIERRIEEYKKKTQEINQAYSVLSDPVAREAYDRPRKERAQAAYRAPDPSRAGPYAQRRANPAPPPQTPVEEKMPVRWIAGLVVVLIVIFSSFVSLFASVFLTDGLRPAGSSGGLSSRDLQETQNAIQATYIVRTQNAQLPTATPRPPLENRNIGKAFYDSENYGLAEELYTLALSQSPQNAQWHVERGFVYVQMMVQDATYFDRAMADFDRALLLDDAVHETYLGRAEAQYRYSTLPQNRPPSPEAIQRIQDDLLQYIERTGDIEHPKVKELQALLDG